jgi:hypothetical protein
MGDKENFDVGTFLNEFDKEFEETAVPETQGDDEVVEETTEKVEEVVEEITETPEQEPEELEETPVEETVEPEEKPTQDVDVNDPDIHKRNEAFKKLREEKQKLEESDKLLGELAAQYGISKEELITKFKEDRIKKQAESQGMSVEQYKRLQALENEVSTIREQYQREAFNFEAERLVRKYNLSEKEVEGAILQISGMGVDVLSNPKLLEPMYKALNYDTAVEKGRQVQLQETKKRRESTASPTLGTRGTNVDTSETDMDGEIDAFLQEKLGFK